MFCWLIGHNWVGGYDPYFQQCLRCTKVRPKHFEGTVPCPFCNKPVNEPIKNSKSEPSDDYPFEIIYFNGTEKVICPHCEKKVLFTREDHDSDWNKPVLIIDFKMDQ